MKNSFFIIAILFLFAPIGASALSVDSANYDPGETITVTCSITSHNYEVYDITDGIDGAAGNGGDIGTYTCSGGSSLTFPSQDGHTYSILEQYATVCTGLDYDQCAIQSFTWAEINFTVGTGATPGTVGHSSFALATNKAVYAPNESITVSCAYGRDPFEVYDLTSGENLGLFECSNPTISLPTVSDHMYGVVEMSYSSSCEASAYDECTDSDFARDDIGFSVSESAGGGISLSEGTNKSTYAPAESILFVCSVAIDNFQVYDITDGISGAIAAGGNVIGGTCSSPATITFDSQAGHSYAIEEISNGTSCSDLDYADCLQQGFARRTYFFSVVQVAARRLISYPPVVKISAPVGGSVFSKQAQITYSVTDKNDIDPPEVRAQLGLGKNPVSIYYSSKISSWDHAYIPAEDKILITNNLAASGTYTWDVSSLTPGVEYRVIVDALDQSNNLGEYVSDPFTVDFAPPQFVVSADPHVTRGENITVTVESNEKLASPPQVTVTQEGTSAVTVEMSLKDNVYQGTYKPRSGFDGVAHIAVQGVDSAGNTGSTTVSGGTFAVGIDPPPIPKITTPRSNNIVSDIATTTVSGTVRPNTTVLLTVNGVDTYTATPDKKGAFTVTNIRLSKTLNRGLNTISVEAKDITNMLSGPATIKIKVNVPPTIELVAPQLDAKLRDVIPLVASSTDQNGDPLHFTYQVIAQKDFDSTLATTSPKNEWLTVADAISSTKYAWDTTEVEDGIYFCRIMVDDGLVKTYTQPRRMVIRNTLPYFRFEDGRKTVSAHTPVTVTGRVLEPSLIVGSPTIKAVEYSEDNGRTWVPVKINEGQAEARFSVTLSQFTEDGTYGLLWHVKDSRGLVGRANHPVIIDTTPPAVPSIVTPRKGTVLTDEDDEDAREEGLQVSFSVQAEPQSKVTLTFDGATTSARADIDGVAVFHGVTFEKRGAHTFGLTATDEAGNARVSQQSVYIYDNPPEASFLEPKPSRGLSGVAEVSWRITDPDNDPVRSILSYRKGAGKFTELARDLANNTYRWDVSAFSEGGDYELRLIVHDGLATSTETIGFYIDKTSPKLDSFALARTELGAKDTLAGSGKASDALSGIEYVEYAVVPQHASADEKTEWVTALVNTGFLRHTSTFSIKHPHVVLDGIYDILVRAVDAAGNTSGITKSSFTVDTQPPRIGTFTASMNGTEITADKKGNVPVYANAQIKFGISLEDDTATSSITVGKEVYPLRYDIASGLWLSQTMIASATTSRICISAQDELRNGFTNKCIGEFEIRPRGVVRDSHDENALGLSGANIRVFAFNAEKQNYEPLPAAQGGAQIQVQTAKDGSYELVLPQGAYTLLMTFPGYRTVEQELSMEENGPVSSVFETEKLSPLQVFFQTITDYIHSIR